MLDPSEPGVRRCMRCGWLFVSPDRLRIRRCHDCKQGEDGYTPRTTAADPVCGPVRGHPPQRDY